MNCLKILNSFYHTPLLRMQCVKYASHYPIRYSEVEERWKEKDGMSKKWNLIYKAPMDNFLNFSSAYLTFSTTTIGCSALYYSAFIFDINKIDQPVLIGDELVIANDSMECLIYLGAFILFHTALKVFLSRYVIRLYNHNDEYVAIFRGHWYNTIKKHKFHLNDFKKLSPTLVVTWGDSRFSLGNKYGILLDEYFKTPAYFNYLLYKKKPGNSDVDAE